MQNLMDALEDVKRAKAELDKANDAMRKASSAHQDAVKKASDLKRDFDSSVADLIPSTRIAKAS